VTGCWGLGENIVQGAVILDEFLVFKPSLARGKKAVISRHVGSKSKTMVYSAKGGVINLETTLEKQKALVLSDFEVESLGRWAVQIEQHYRSPMDIEWAKDGNSGQLFIVQARPETIHAGQDPYLIKEFTLTAKGKLLTSGYAVSAGITSGKVKIILSPAEADILEEGDILVTEITNPDWDPIMEKAAAIITTKGGRTSHAAIIAREMGTLAIVGAEGAFEVLKNGDMVTLDNSSGKIGKVYEGKLDYKTTDHDFHASKDQAHVYLSRSRSGI
jgi:pyruvate,water dikinase